MLRSTESQILNTASRPVQIRRRHFRYLNVNVNVNKQYLSTCKSCNKGYDGCAMRVVFSKLQNCLVSTTVTLGMAVVHSNIWDQKLRRHVNQM